jgi:hypothetical protein
MRERGSPSGESTRISRTRNPRERARTPLTSALGMLGCFARRNVVSAKSQPWYYGPGARVNVPPADLGRRTTKSSTSEPYSKGEPESLVRGF